MNVWLVTNRSSDGIRIIGIGATRPAAVKLAQRESRERDHYELSWTSDPDADERYISDDLDSRLFAEAAYGIVVVEPCEVVE